MKPQAPGKRSRLTTQQVLFQQHLLELGIATEAEFQFFPERRWRFDLASTEYRLGFEINGHFRGRHGAGWSNDAEKINTAQALGWRVFVFDNRAVEKGKAIAWVREWLCMGWDAKLIPAVAGEALSGKEVPKSPANRLPSAATGIKECSSE